MSCLTEISYCNCLNPYSTGNEVVAILYIAFLFTMNNVLILILLEMRLLLTKMNFKQLNQKIVLILILLEMRLLQAKTRQRKAKNTVLILILLEMRLLRFSQHATCSGDIPPVLILILLEMRLLLVIQSLIIVIVLHLVLILILLEMRLLQQSLLSTKEN